MRETVEDKILESCFSIFQFYNSPLFSYLNQKAIKIIDSLIIYTDQSIKYNMNNLSSNPQRINPKINPTLFKQNEQQNQHQLFDQDIVNERFRKYKQIMKMINNYKRTPEELTKLDKIKKETKCEIELRFINSRHNRLYKFPFMTEQITEEQEQFGKGDSMYDLHAQAEIIPKSISMKVLTLDSKRRVKSLEKSDIHDDAIRREIRRPINGIVPIRKIKDKKTEQVDQGSKDDFSPIRKNSLTDRKNNLSSIRLPELKSNERIKSKKKVNLGEIVGKKIMTEASPNKDQGIRLAKYLKNLQCSAKSYKQNQPKKFFLKQY